MSDNDNSQRLRRLATDLKKNLTSHELRDIIEAAEKIEQLLRERESLRKSAQTIPLTKEAYDRGYAVGSGDEGYYQRTIAKLRAALVSIQTRLASDKGIVLRSELIEECEKALLTEETKIDKNGLLYPVDIETETL